MSAVIPISVMDVRNEFEKIGYTVTDEEFGKLIEYTNHKAAVLGKGKDYIMVLLPDVMKEYFIRKETNDICYSVLNENFGLDYKGTE